jgi:cholesterol transport system auxiliary component
VKIAYGHSRPGSAIARLGAAAALAGSLGACSAILPQRPPAIYDLKPPEAISSSSRTQAQILIPVPSALRALSTERIAARPSAQEYAYLPGATWSDVLPRLVQTRLLETFQNTGRVHAAALPGQGLMIDYQVIVDVRAFELTGAGGLVDLNVTVMNDKTGRVVASREFRDLVPVAGAANPAVVAALNTAMDRVFGEIVRWTLTRV